MRDSGRLMLRRAGRRSSRSSSLSASRTPSSKAFRGREGLEWCPVRARASCPGRQARCRMVGLRPPLPGSGSASVGRRTHGVPTASHLNEAWRGSDDIRAQALLDRPPSHRLAEKNLNGAVHLARSHRLALHSSSREGGPPSARGSKTRTPPMCMCALSSACSSSRNVASRAERVLAHCEGQLEPATATKREARTDTGSSRREHRLGVARALVRPADRVHPEPSLVSAA